MASTSKKHREFTGEPMGDKPVTDVAGIGPVLGLRLCEAGCDKAYVLLGKFLMVHMNGHLFTQWLKETINANSKQATDCYRCLQEWCDSFL
ncbi:barrier-to-autointegration factor-like [Anneissia japonica]|uniref:barrier-to-autointegration factor-like n=1 Tax=Anneissia japonica TaxID=1529436 RepID=UPI0014258D6E|nr:barrier-to-autointegration factor-like [Anneissia japonica]